MSQTKAQAHISAIKEQLAWMSIGDIVRVKRKFQSIIGTIISTDPFKVYEKSRITKIPLRDIKSIHKMEQPTMKEFYDLSCNDYPMFVNLYEKYPVDINYVGPLINEDGYDERLDYNADFCPSFLMGALGYGLNSADFLELALYMLDKGGKPTKKGWVWLIKHMDMENCYKFTGRLPPNAEKVLLWFLAEDDIDPFESINESDSDGVVYPLMEYAKAHPAFMEKLLAIEKVKTNPLIKGWIVPPSQ